MKLYCKSQNYKWGKLGENSLVGKIVKSQEKYSHEKVNSTMEYAEYWMGTHINAPSMIGISNKKQVLLNEYLEKNFNLKELPFLFKVLSIRKPLSIQVHPDIITAELLHNKFPDVYKDNKNKPEMAIVISEEFCMLYGIKTINNFKDLNNSNKKLYEYLLNKYFGSTNKNSNLDINKDDYLALINYYISLEKEDTDKTIKEIIEIVNSSDKNSTTNSEDLVSLLNLLNKEFNSTSETNDDKGILFSLFMNYCKLKKGDSVFIDDNIPHSYIEGEIMECMINSDFVIRLGLTPKATDIKSFSDILNQKFGNLIIDKENNSYLNFHKSLTYESGVINTYKYKDFNGFFVHFIEHNNENEYTYDVDNHSILFCLDSSKDNSLFFCSEYICKEIPIDTYDCLFLEANSKLTISKKCKLFIASYK